MLCPRTGGSGQGQEKIKIPPKNSPAQARAAWAGGVWGGCPRRPSGGGASKIRLRIFLEKSSDFVHGSEQLVNFGLKARN
jgi:hypothetical protein